MELEFPLLDQSRNAIIGSEAGTGVASLITERKNMAHELAQLTQQAAGSGATTFTKSPATD